MYAWGISRTFEMARHIKDFNESRSVSELALLAKLVGVVETRTYQV